MVSKPSSLSLVHFTGAPPFTRVLCDSAQALGPRQLWVVHPQMLRKVSQEENTLLSIKTPLPLVCTQSAFESDCWGFAGPLLLCLEPGSKTQLQPVTHGKMAGWWEGAGRSCCQPCVPLRGWWDWSLVGILVVEVLVVELGQPWPVKRKSWRQKLLFHSEKHSFCQTQPDY